MLMFWIVMPLLLVIGLLFVLVPLIKKPTQGAVTSLQTALANEKLLQLKQELTRSEISQAEYNRLTNELTFDINKQHVLLSNNKPNFFLVTVVGVFFILLAAFLYQHWGAFTQVHETTSVMQRTEQVKAEIAELGSPQKIIDRLKAQVTRSPDARGFYLLGRLYFSDGQFKLALDNYQTANQLQPNDPQILTAIAEAQFFQHQRKLTKSARNLLDQVLAEHPNDINALNLLAVNAYVQHDYSQAIQYWQRIVALLPPNSEETTQLLALIEKAQAQSSENVNATAQAINLSIRVSVSNALADQVQPGDYLLVYAKEVNGSPMPVAVIKQRVQQLPVTLELNEHTNMLPNMTLKQAEQIIITARISKTGDAMQQPGDLLGQSSIINAKQAHGMINVVIDKRSKKDF